MAFSLSRLRTGLTKQQGHPVQFVLQLEYWHADEWLQVARFDHDEDGPDYQNVEASGLHLDVLNPDGSQIAKLTHWQSQPSNEAMGDADEYLRENAQDLIRRFETWL